ncbi:tripartite tricarboxylate transporter substrate binding protein [Roseiarcaceae bacterium H3SJ34-1]|uniref:Bug family tripartite tricarboxylate transporter substrate binding protein n=1 Tax=Terripilifer ovatus TaxID=3032367 RepID=UPI003AB9B95B|nr:tripartite tricarboxylate transporter substrate binding protein [Roseiarcaceae bacterium H3SJ34-1]
MNLDRRGFIAGVAGSLAAPFAHAQDAYPSRQVRVIMPFPAGSGTDTLARLIAEQLAKRWGQSVIVDNMSGAGGNIGGQTVTHAAPDGYTLLFVPAPPLVINQFMYKHQGYEPLKLTPISMIASVPYAMVVRKDFPATNVKEFVAYAKANPGKVTYASSSVGSTAHLAAVQLQMMTGVQMVHVPYRGAAPALNDVMGGHIDMVFDIVSTARPMWEANMVKVFATGGKTRSRIMPTIPTMEEAGFPGYLAVTWFAMTAPPGTPAPVIDRIYAGVIEALNIPEVAERIRGLGMDSVGMNPADSGRYFAREADMWSKIVKAAAISLD